MSIQYKDDIKAVCWQLESLAEQFKGWTLEKYLRFLKLQEVQDEQFNRLFKGEER